jgi:hypothetical protein
MHGRQWFAEFSDPAAMLRPLLAVFVLAIAAMQPLLALDLSDPLYAKIDRWEILGYLKPLYTLRPYSPEVLIGILEQVMVTGSALDKREAEEALATLKLLALTPAIGQTSILKFGSDQFDYRGESIVGFNTRGNLIDTLWIDGSVSLVLLDGRSRLLPVGTGSALDLNDDGSMFFLPEGLSGDAMGVLYGLSSSTWYGSGQLWGSAAYGRSTVGPFWNNGIFIGPQARAAPNWTLHGSFGSFRYSGGLFQIRPQAPGRSFNHDKFIAFHSYSFEVIPGLDLGLVEGVVWAGSFKPLYLMPMSMLFHLQSVAGSGYGDNSLAGAYGTWRPLPGVLLKGSMYFDDVGVKELSRFDFDTKILGAIQAGVAWAPIDSMLRLIEVDYTAVFPYMYTHRPSVAGVQDNYTHYGESFGTGLQPNSDRVQLSAQLVLPAGFSVILLSKLMRHGNASEGLNDLADGSWFDDGWWWQDSWGRWLPTYQLPYPATTTPRYFRFLSQSIIEVIFQIGGRLSWMPVYGLASHSKLAGLALHLGYTLELAWNRDLVPGNNAPVHYLQASIGWRQ